MTPDEAIERIRELCNEEGDGSPPERVLLHVLDVLIQAGLVGDDERGWA